MKRLCQYAALAILLATAFPMDAKEYYFKAPNGQKKTLDVCDGESFKEVIERVGWFNFSVRSVTEEHERNYQIPATAKQADMITYVITTMGFKGYGTLFKEREKLKATKKPLINLHPFRFLEVIFTGEETIAAMPNIKDKRFVWPEFKNGLYPSLTEEAQKGNLKIDDVKDFAHNVKVDPKVIIPAIKAKDWDQLVELLIENVPRKGNPNRLDM